MVARMPWLPSAEDTPFARLGGEPKVRALVERFYDAMGELEPELARLHACDADGRVSRDSRDRFALFLVGWLGGPQDYTERHGHPRLRQRHAAVPVNDRMRDAWLRCMGVALDEAAPAPEVRAFLDEKLSQLAFHLRNTD